MVILGPNIATYSNNVKQRRILQKFKKGTIVFEFHSTKVDHVLFTAIIFVKVGLTYFHILLFSFHVTSLSLHV